MYLLVAAIAVLVVLSWVVNRINAQHDAKRAAQSETDDARVSTAWDEFGGGDDPATWRAALDSLLERVDLAQLENKHSLVRLGVMAIRANHLEPLPEIARRAMDLDPQCGETRSLDALAAAYNGSAERAIPKLQGARAKLAGCSGCAAGVEGKILTQEVEIALDALSSGEVLDRSARPVASSGSLSVQIHSHADESAT